jgi:hypothetical protein
MLVLKWLGLSWKEVAISDLGDERTAYTWPTIVQSSLQDTVRIHFVSGVKVDICLVINSIAFLRSRKNSTPRPNKG